MVCVVYCMSGEGARREGRAELCGWQRDEAGMQSKVSASAQAGGLACGIITQTTLLSNPPQN